MAFRTQWADIRSILFKVLLAGVSGVLAAAIFFSLREGAIEKAHAVACASNLKQIGLGLLQYAQDNDGKLPNVAQPGSSTQTWRTAIYPYIKSHSVFQCPSRTPFDALDGFPISYAANDSGVYGHSVGFQGLGAFAPAGAKPLATSDYPDPSNLISLCEITRTADYDFDTDDSVRFLNRNGRLWAGHDGQLNIVFADGHLGRYDPSEAISHSDNTQQPPKNMWYRNTTTPLSVSGVDVVQHAAL